MSELHALQHDSLSPDYWARRWVEGDAFWHQQNVNDFLIAHLPALDAVKAAVPSTRRPRLFVPLCGATVDMAYLMAQGWHVVGLDAVEQPLRGFVDAHRAQLRDVRDERTALGVHISAEHIDLYEADLFSPAVTPAFLGGAVDAVWDRGSFVAIGLQQRKAYVEKVVELIDHSLAGLGKPNWLLNAFEYAVHSRGPAAVSRCSLSASLTAASRVSVPLPSSSLRYNTDSAFEAPPHNLPRDVVADLVKSHATAVDVLEIRSAMARFSAIRGLNRYDVVTSAITISR